MDELKPGELTDVQKADVLEKLIPEIEGGLNIHYYELAALRRAVVVLRRPAPENKHRLLDTIHDLRNENNRLRTEIERMRNAAPENKPLTLEQLRQMVDSGEWVWVEMNFGTVGWCKPFQKYPLSIKTVDGGYITELDFDRGFVVGVYARKPEVTEE